MGVDRSFVYSIIKCDYGWNSQIPVGCDSDEWEKIIAESQCAVCAAKKIASDIFFNDGRFNERFDGKPNTRSVLKDLGVVELARVG